MPLHPLSTKTAAAKLWRHSENRKQESLQWLIKDDELFSGMINAIVSDQ